MKKEAEYKLEENQREVSLSAEAYQKDINRDGLLLARLTQCTPLKGTGPFQDSRLSSNARKCKQHFSGNVRRGYRVLHPSSGITSLLQTPPAAAEK